MNIWSSEENSLILFLSRFFLTKLKGPLVASCDHFSKSKYSGKQFGIYCEGGKILLNVTN